MVEPGTAGLGEAVFVTDRSAMLGWKPRTVGCEIVPLVRNGM